MSKSAPRPTSENDTPPSPSRRALFQGAAVVGGAVLIGSVADNPTFARQATKSGSMASAFMDAVMEAQPFYGLHQSGIVNPAPPAAIFASFNVLAADRKELVQLLKVLTERFAFLTQGGPAATAKPLFPPPDSGILGPDIAPHNLTITLAVGDSLFDERFGLALVKPKRLSRMVPFPNDRLDAAWCHGDLMLQFCAESAEVAIHALRDILKHTPASLMLRWKQDGFLPETAARSHGRLTPRNMLGFKDGTANPAGSNAPLMDSVVWVQPGSNEPSWTAGGSYQAVRLIENLVESWDRTPLKEQENIIGRDKASGAPLGMTHEHDIPDYSADPEGKKIALDAHMRLANPRTPQTQNSLIMRRPFNYSRGVNRAGQLEMGLIFVCFQADLEAGFIAVQNRLNGEPFEEYIKPNGGGYFFVLPGVQRPGNYLGQQMIEALPTPV